MTTYNSAVDSIVIPLEQGLRPTVDYCKVTNFVFYCHSIRTRIKTALYSSSSSGQFCYSIVIPLEQGLRPCILNTGCTQRLFYCHSIRTRIKTKWTQNLLPEAFLFYCHSIRTRIKTSYLRQKANDQTCILLSFHQNKD